MAGQPPHHTYSSYLQLDKVLGAQEFLSAAYGKPAHDEMLFIVIHQVYELWFKEIIHELDFVLSMFGADHVDEESVGIAVAKLTRVTEIQKIMLDQIKVIETITPLDFLDFRHYFGSASGFQSFQFRIVENKLGLRRSDRMLYSERPYDSEFNPQIKEAVERSENETSLYVALERWLERTPFLDLKGFSFLEAYRQAVEKMLSRDTESISSNTALSEGNKQMRLKMIAGTRAEFELMLDPVRYEELRTAGKRRLSYRATMAALFINLYRDQPILHLPYKLLCVLLDIDEHMSLWRYRHALMVLRMLGGKVGSGGSSGFSYLRDTVEKHRIFVDLFQLSTLMIPRSELPELPPAVKNSLAFAYSI